MYTSFLPLAKLKVEQTRIYDPFAYRLTNRARFIRVSLHETFELAALYPVVFIRNEVGALSLQVVRALRADQQVSRVEAFGLFSLPLLLQAYPLRFRSVETGDFALGMDSVAPERERDQGAYVYHSDGSFMPGAELKLEALEAFKDGYEIQNSLATVLSQTRLLEPLQLPAELVEECALPDMYAVRDTADWDRALTQLPESARAAALRFLVAQRVSLFRMGALVAAANAGKSAS